MTPHELTNRVTIPHTSDVIVKGSLKNTVFATNSNLDDCATIVNAILRFLTGNEVEMPIPSEQGDNFSAYADITRERSARVLDGLNQIAENLGIEL